MSHYKISESGLNVVSLYTGAGGLDLGFEAAGFQTRVAVEMDKHARETLRANRPNWKQPEGGDVLRLTPQDLLNIGGLAPGEADVLMGGPPCQPFSKSAFWVAGSTKRLDDPRARTLGAMLEFAEALLPRVLVIENVRGIAYREKDEAAKLVEERLAEINERHHTRYKVSIAYLQATDFGVPQIRERAFLVAFRDGQHFEAPVPITGPNLEHPIATTWDAIGEMNITEAELKQLKPRGKWGELLGSIPEGQNYLWHTDRGQGLPLFGWRTRYWSFLLKLAKDKPAWTIQANPGPATGPFHWDGRALSVAEMARLQSFPLGYSFVGDYRAARRQIGNAVPPALAEAVARRIVSTLQGTPYCPQVHLAVPDKGPAPPPTPARDVPAKYRQLIGDHKAHPGPGKGPAALLRKPSSETALGREDLDAIPADLGGEEQAAA